MSSELVQSRSSNQRKHESRNPVQRFLIDRFHQAAAKLVRQTGARRLLELGCGEGYVLEALLNAGVRAELTGVELDPRAAEVARARLGDRARVVAGDAREFLGRERGFDLVLMLEVLEHLDAPEEMLSLLESLPAQWFLLSVPWEPWFRLLNLARGKNLFQLGNDPGHVNHWGRFGRRSFQRLVSRNLKLVDTAEVFPWNMVLASKR